MKITHKGVAMACGFAVRSRDDGTWYWYSPGYFSINGNCATEEEAWKKCCLDNKLTDE